MSSLPLSSPTYDLIWLMWLDTLERLDTILLELRHHQVNLIHALRCSELYEVLRYEEDYIWGSYKDEDGKTHDWLSLLAQPKGQKNLSDIAALWTIQYPDLGQTGPSKTPGGTGFYDNDRRSGVDGSVHTAIHGKLNDGEWRSDKRRLYFALRALQILKTNILYDKLTLCRWGIRAQRQAERATMAGRFLIVRAAVMSQAHEHIKRLGDLRAQFEAALDLGIQDHPKPLVGRRREQGIYSSYLSERCNDLRMLIDNFLEAALADGNERRTHGAIYMHRWNHSAASDVSFIRSTMDYDAAGSQADMHSVDLFNTSFFMPDRPDLQSVIAHEVSHAAILYGLGNLEPHTLKKAEGSLATLLRLISAIVQEYSIGNLNGGDPRYELRQIHREIGCDIIACVAKGPAYLFALTQEILGQDLDLLFSSPLRRVDFALADHVLTAGWASLKHPGFEWYLRLRTVCSILKGLTAENDHLSTTLINGVTGMAEVLLDTVEQLAPPPLAKEITLWRGMTSTVVRVIEQSALMDDAKQWRTNRDRFADGESQDQPFVDGDFPDAARKLPAEFNTKLLDLLIELKQKPHRLLHDMEGKEKTEIDKAFVERYLGGKSKKNVFRYLYDIPWQSAMMRARDFTCPKHGVMAATERPDWLKLMHLDGAPGRHLYQIALELTYWLHDASVDTIRGIIGYMQASTVRKEINRCPDGIKSLMLQWVDPQIDNTPEFVAAGLLRLNKTQKKNPKKVVTESRAVAASNPRLFLTMHESLKTSNLNQNARRDRLFRQMRLLKIQQLHEALEKMDKINLPGIQTLCTYLRSVRRHPEVRDALLKGLTQEKNGMPASSPLIMLDRVVISDEIYNKVPWAHFWQPLPCQTSERDSESPGRVYTKVLGRFDIIGLTVNEPPARSYLPQLVEADKTHPIFFERHEMAMPFRLDDDAPIPTLPSNGDTPGKLSNGPIAFLCVTLGSRAARLDFLYRLQETFKKKGKPDDTVDKPAWHEIGGLFSPGDMVLLTEGWGDVVIVFMGAGAKRLEDIFRVQSAIYEDFLVDQTELILSSPCLKSAVNAARWSNFNTLDWPYTVITRVKLRGNASRAYDTSKDQKNTEATPNATFVEKVSDYLNDKCSTRKGLTLTRTPGRTDFTIHYYCPRLLDIKRTEDTAEQSGIYELFANADEVLTILSRRENISTPSPQWHCPEADTCPKCAGSS